MLPSIDGQPLRTRPRGRLRLRFRGQELVLGESSQTDATMGRADDNDVVIKGNLISRVHARIDLRKNRFVLVDESTNGTFIQRDDGEEIYVRRDSTELTGSGVIGMGRVAARGTPLAIEYSSKNQPRRRRRIGPFNRAPGKPGDARPSVHSAARDPNSAK